MGVIECQVWSGPFDATKVHELYSNTIHWILQKDMNQWKQSRIQYSHLMPSSQEILLPTMQSDPGRELLQYISHKRSLGPHLWFEVKQPQPIALENCKNEKQDNPLLAVGVLPLFYYEDKMVIKQGLQNVRLYPVGKNAFSRSNEHYFPLHFAKEMNYRQEKLNELYRFQGLSWIDQQAKKRLESSLPIPVPADFIPRGDRSCNYVPKHIIGLLNIELPRFSSPNVLLHFHQLTNTFEERINLIRHNQNTPEFDQFVQRKWEQKIPLKDK